MKNVRHIDIVMRFFYPVTAGIETSVLETYSEMVRKGWSVTVHTSSDTYLNKNSLKKNDAVKGIHIKRYPFSFLGFIPQIDWKTTTIVSLHNSDMFPHFFIFVYTILLKLLRKKKYSLILTPHGGFYPEWKSFSLFPRIIKRTYHKTLLPLLINASIDGFRAVSDWEMEESTKKGINKKFGRVIKNGIEDEAYVDVEKLASKEIKAVVKKLGKYIFQMGRIYHIKNYETVIKALPYLPQEIQYVIAGPVQATDNYLSYLKSLAKQLHVEKRIKFIGILHGVDKFYVIKHAELMVHMALWESYCNVVHEAMSQGKVCIVANNSALPYLIKDDINGFCVKTKDSTALAQKIQFVLSNKDSMKIKQMEQRNQLICKTETWKNVAVELNDFYLERI
ncbi:MAG TPA: glycosyltransferase [Candidatus Eisenbacteria bacterium]|nr:glycosyltransferase [Candidatus Eisenbacteria bacterium]